MNAKDFNILFENRVSTCRTTLIDKASEYASDTERLHNFKVGARLLDTTPEKALWGMMLKHLISVMDLVNEPEKATQWLISEKISDNINYLILLEALLTERLKEPEGTYSASVLDGFFKDLKTTKLIIND